jgi:hypothetical protein
MFDAKRAIALMDELRLSAEALKLMPEMIPIAQEIMKPVFNGATPAVAPIRRQEPLGRRQGRQMSKATKAKLRRAAKARWAMAKKTGRKTIGGALR